MRPHRYTPPPPPQFTIDDDGNRLDIASMSAVYHALRHRGTAAMSGGGYRVALIRHLRRAV